MNQEKEGSLTRKVGQDAPGKGKERKRNDPIKDRRQGGVVGRIRKGRKTDNNRLHGKQARVEGSKKG